MDEHRAPLSFRCFARWVNVSSRRDGAPDGTASLGRSPRVAWLPLRSVTSRNPWIGPAKVSRSESVLLLEFYSGAAEPPGRFSEGFLLRRLVLLCQIHP
jgi:hypothetical protein